MVFSKKLMIVVFVSAVVTARAEEVHNCDFNGQEDWYMNLQEEQPQVVAIKTTPEFDCGYDQESLMQRQKRLQKMRHQYRSPAAVYRR